MEKLGERKARMVAKIAGGASMFTFQGRNDMMQVGERNVQAVKKKLKEINIQMCIRDRRIRIPGGERRGAAGDDAGAYFHYGFLFFVKGVVPTSEI